MGEPAFDTLNIAKELERDFGFEQKQAEGAAMMIHRHLVGNVATKEDLAQTGQKLSGEIKDVRKDIQHVDEKLSGEIKDVRKDIQHVDEKLSGEITRVEEKLSGEIKLMGRDMTIRLGAVIVGVIVVFEALNRFFPITP